VTAQPSSLAKPARVASLPLTVVSTLPGSGRVSPGKQLVVTRAANAIPMRTFMG
jgi:hypothetical protein